MEFFTVQLALFDSETFLSIGADVVHSGPS